MTSSWKQQLVQIFLILVSCGHVNTNKNCDPGFWGFTQSAERKYDDQTASPTPPSAPIAPLYSTSKSAIFKDENLAVTVELVDPVIMTLNCTWTGNQNKVSNITGLWEKNGQILGSPVTVDLISDQYNLLHVFNVVSEEDLGNYSCVFGNEARADFTLTVPQMDNKRDKPVVGYVRDFVSMACKMEDSKPKPSTFYWFMSNGTNKERILATEVSERYKITNVNYTTKLTVKNLSLADSGWYYCSAVYPLGTSMSKAELKVITLMEPLKPFIAILIEVVVLVILILLYERMRAKNNTEGAQTIAEQKNTEPQEDDKGAEGRTSVRQRKA